MWLPGTCRQPASITLQDESRESANGLIVSQELEPPPKAVNPALSCFLENLLVLSQSQKRKQEFLDSPIAVHVQRLSGRGSLIL